MALKIGELAERGGVNLQTIRYYERERLLPEPPRLPSGYWLFPVSTVRRVYQAGTENRLLVGGNSGASLASHGRTERHGTLTGAGKGGRY